MQKMALDSPFQDLEKDVTAALVQTTKTSGQIANEDLQYLRTLEPKLAKALDEQNGRLLKIIRDLVRTAASGTDIRPPNLVNAESLDEQWQKLVDVVDHLLEKADRCLDEYTGAINKATPDQEAAADNKKTTKSNKSQNLSILKPQLSFENVPKNDETTPFKPLLKSKPHAIIPFEESIQLASTEDSTQG
jgi:exosome complex exonuclease RRP6